MRALERKRLNGQQPTEQVLTREAIVEALDRESRRRRGMTALKLVRAYRQGMLEDPGEVADILGLASLLPRGDKFFVES